ncbi:MAG: prolipoprotein diacylglyceryl transferase [Cyclobacteriaceae bacterium]|nr:prolipoprotein diacylglyceryl transferase [Cyclobacteriaceae bacterium]
MNLFSYIIWNASPDIFSIGPITLRWYGLLFALGFLLSQQILYYIYKQEGKPEKDVDTLTIYMVIATIIGARLGHVFFYEPERYLANPIDIIKIWEGGLASHGAAFGILFALWLYTNFSISFSKTDVDLKEGKGGSEGKVKKKTKSGFFIERRRLPGQSYLQVLDRIVILVALTGALIRFGNFFNSEIIGKPTESNSGVVFVRNVTETLKNESAIEDVHFSQGISQANKSFQPIKLLIEFKANEDSSRVAAFMNTRFYDRMLYSGYVREHLHIDETLNYKVGKEGGHYAAVVNTYAIPRHPAQLYEAISCILLSALLFWIWYRDKANLPEGRIFGIFMIVLWSLRFAYEYLKEVQVSSELDFIAKYGINYGQLYSIPLVIVGIVVLILSFRNKKQEVNG